MTFWTLMLLTFAPEGQGEMEARLLFPNAAACGDALPLIHDTIEANYPGSSAKCHVTRILSTSPRPRRRPQ